MSIEITRQQAVSGMADYLRDALVSALDRATRTCLNCERFDEPTEMCEKFQARPPARIIAHGCDEHEEEVPF